MSVVQCCRRIEIFPEFGSFSNALGVFRAATVLWSDKKKYSGAVRELVFKDFEKIFELLFPGAFKILRYQLEAFRFCKRYFEYSTEILCHFLKNLPNSESLPNFGSRHSGDSSAVGRD